MGIFPQTRFLGTKKGMHFYIRACPLWHIMLFLILISLLLLAVPVTRPIWGWQRQKLFSAYQDNRIIKCLLMCFIWLWGFHRYVLEICSFIGFLIVPFIWFTCLHYPLGRFIVLFITRMIFLKWGNCFSVKYINISRRELWMRNMPAPSW
jgi:hypothetical protein